MKIWDSTKDKAGWAYFMQMGTGKSKVGIDTMAYNCMAKNIDIGIIMGRKGDYRNWDQHHLPEHWPDDIPFTLYRWGVTKKKDLKHLNAILNREPQVGPLPILLINTEAFSYKKAVEFVTKLCKGKRVFCIIDESSQIRKHQSNRTKNLLKLEPMFDYTRIMSGLPNPNAPLDLFTQSQFCKSNALGKSYFGFKNRYAVTEKMTIKQGGALRQFNKIVGYRNLDEITEKLKKFSSRVTIEECVDLPSKIYKPIYVEMTDEQKKLYESMRDLAMAAINDELITVTHQLTQLTKLHQITCGHIKDEEGNVTNIENNLLDEMMNIIERCPGKKFVIWCSFRQDIHNVVEKLREGYGDKSIITYHGGTSDADRAKSIPEFQRGDGDARFFVSTQQTGGFGSTLTASHHVIYVSRSYDLEHREQSEARTYRIGQTEQCIYFDLITPGTVNQKIYQVLKEKKKISDLVLQYGIEDLI